MALNGVDAIVFGVKDMGEAKRFLDDWGVALVTSAADKLVYKTRDGAEVIVQPHDKPELPQAIESGNTVREIIWGAANQEELTKTLDSVRGLEGFHVGGDGLPRVKDPNGLSLAFRVSKRSPMVV